MCIRDRAAAERVFMLLDEAEELADAPDAEVLTQVELSLIHILGVLLEAGGVQSQGKGGKEDGPDPHWQVYCAVQEGGRPDPAAAGG